MSCSNTKINLYKFNHIKVETDKGWRTYRHQNNLQRKIYFKKIRIDGEESLLFNPPRNVYVSVNKFLDYREHKKTYKFQNKILKRYGLIDIDSQEFGNFRESKRYFMQTLKFLLNNGIRINEVNMTNRYGGFQAVIDADSYDNFHKLFKENEHIFINCDKRVMNDERRVRRYVPSWNGNKSTQAFSLFLLDCLDLTTPNVNRCNPAAQSLNIEEISQKIDALGMPFEANDKGGERVITLSNPDKIQGKVQIKSNGLSHFLVKEIKSNVYGLKSAFVPVLKFSSKPSYNRLRKLQNRYRLGDMYVFNAYHGFMAICPKIASKRRLEKVYKAAKCWVSLNELNKYYCNFIQVCGAYSIIDKQVIFPLKFLGILEQEAQGWYSFGHLRFLRNYYKKDYENSIGIKNPIFIAKFNSL